MTDVQRSLKLSESFRYDHLFIRPGPSASTPVVDFTARLFYLANSLLKTILVNNDHIRMRLLYAGAKVFGKQNKGEVPFRILDEGLETMLPYVRENQIIQGDVGDLKPLLREQYPFFNKFPEGSFRTAIEKHSVGNVIGKFYASKDQLHGPDYPMTMSLWRSNVSISLMISKSSKKALSLRLFGEEITPAELSSVDEPQELDDPSKMVTKN